MHGAAGFDRNEEGMFDPGTVHLFQKRFSREAADRGFIRTDLFGNESL
jgi:hypothetical protein